MTSVILAIVVFWLAYSNGANDNFKGVATLYGSGTTDYRRSLVLATLATLAGSVLSLMLASTLAKACVADALIPPELAGHSFVLISVGAGAAVTILIATFVGMPTSTTHALTGALFGVSLAAAGSEVPLGRLGTSFLLPLLASPVLAVIGAGVVYPAMRAARRRLGVSSETCVCLASERATAVVGADALANPMWRGGSPDVTLAIAPVDQCTAHYAGRVIGIDAQTAVNAVHTASAAAVCFARAVNDTPKIAALLLAGGAAGGARGTLVLVAAAMALGGVLNSRRVAETMSTRITELNSGQGLTGNLVTAALVLGASHLGVPVSTTHVSCGSLFGIGIVAGTARWRTIMAILVTWVSTLPCAALLGAAGFRAMANWGGM